MDILKIANIFNNFFSTIAPKTKSKIKFSKNGFFFLRKKLTRFVVLTLSAKVDVREIFQKWSSAKVNVPKNLPSIKEYVRKIIKTFSNLLIFYQFGYTEITK